MKVSVDWLAELTGLELDGNDLAKRFTSAGLEVDEVVPAGAALDGVVVAEIVSAEPHPDAERLQLCQVNAGGDELVQIVCGAPNARKGLKAPLATIGGVLPGGMKIKRAKLRGVASFGMLCSARELELSEDTAGLMELPADAPVGQALYDYLTLNDEILTLELTPNRSDCLGMYGLARECSALHERRWEAPEVAAITAENDDTLPIVLNAPDGCPRYVGRVIRDVNASRPSPLWIQERLRRNGVRSISAVVDITNYVLLELGQPMHAFDLNHLEGGIDVRWAAEGEQMTLLDGSEITMNSRHLLITDGTKPVALAGIMGGQGSMVSDETQDVFLESAWFAPPAIMGRARDLGMATDAAHRFERGIDPSIQSLAIERATDLILKICGGKPGPLCAAESAEHLPCPQTVSLRQQRLNALVGIEIPTDRVTAILHDLGMRVEKTDAGWQVTPPPARMDLAIEEDMIEEVVRVFGFDHIPAKRPGGHLRPEPIPEQILAQSRIRDRLCDSGYREAVTYSFVDRQLLKPFGWDEAVIELANPISQDMDVMRPSLVPGLLQALRHNIQHQQQRVRLFELGATFDGEGKETQRVAAICYGSVAPEQWGAAARMVDFFDSKGDLEVLLELTATGAEDRFEPVELAWLHPGQSAAVYRNGERLGWIGALHPSLLQALDIEGQVYAFEMDLQRLQQRNLPVYQAYSRYPSIRRDLSLLVPEAVTAAQLQQAINNQGGAELKSTLVFDVYDGPGVEKGYKSLAIGLILQKDSSTLTDSEADAFVSSLLEELRAQLGVTLRG